MKKSSSSKRSSSPRKKPRWDSFQISPNPAKPPTPQNHSKNPNPKKDLPSSSGAAPPPASGAAHPHTSGAAHPLASGAAHPLASGVASPFSAPVPPPPLYGFQNLERRTIVLSDGSARTYFALPPDYPLEPYGHGGRVRLDRFNNNSPHRDFGPGPHRDFGPGGMRREFFPDGPPRGPPLEMGGQRKFPEEEEDAFAWHRQHVSQYGNAGASSERSPVRRRVDEPGSDVGDMDPQALKRAFLNFMKVINESASQKKAYLEDGKSGVTLQCMICRASFPDVHGLIMHAYTAQKPDQRVDHLGLHKALCVLMGWNYAEAPDNSKAYQSLSAVDATANRADLIVWPPTVILHNTGSGKKKDGRVEGMGNKEMDSKLKELGFGGGKSKSVYGKDGHMGITVVKFASTEAGLKEAERLADYYEKDNHGRKGWDRAQQSGADDEKNPALVKDKKRTIYGYLATAFDLDKFDVDLKKRAVIKSRKEFD